MLLPRAMPKIPFAAEALGIPLADPKAGARIV